MRAYNLLLLLSQLFSNKIWIDTTCEVDQSILHSITVLYTISTNHISHRILICSHNYKVEMYNTYLQNKPITGIIIFPVQILSAHLTLSFASAILLTNLSHSSMCCGCSPMPTEFSKYIFNVASA